MTTTFGATRGIALAAVLAAGLAANPARAADTHERGTVEAVSGGAVTVKTREGKDVSLNLDDGWTVLGVDKASMADIKPGTFVGTATLPDAGEGMKAVEVLVFPETMRGVGEGHYPWDLQPKSMMTNATVTNAVKGVDGQTVTLAYKGGEKKVAITDATPVVRIVPAGKEDVVAGAKVFISTPSDQGGKLAKGVILVGKDGIAPPM